MKVSAQELLSPLADASKYSGHLIDFNVRAERMGWLPSAPQLGRNPLGIKAEADKAGLSPHRIYRPGAEIGRVAYGLRTTR